ncbi:MAG: hypothetical protein ACI9IP_002491 [Arcticibacterium sp.]|jgi:hypothetical protein
MSCNSSENENQEKVFFDLAQFIDTEIAHLESNNVSVLKTVYINEEKETITINDLDWKKELDIIRQSDLNKAAFRLSYDKDSSVSQIAYTLKPSEKLPIVSLRILKNDAGEITQIRSDHKSDNYLYSSSKTAIADFKNGHLSHYNIKGTQELFVGSEKVFEIDGEVLKP